MSPRSSTSPLRHLLQPLNLAGLFTMASVGLTLRWVPAEQQPMAIALLLAFAAAFLARDVVAARWPMPGHVLLVVQPLLALWLVRMTPGLGTAQILLVVWTVVAVIEWPLATALGAVLLADAATWLLFGRHPAQRQPDRRHREQAGEVQRLHQVAQGRGVGARRHAAMLRRGAGTGQCRSCRK